MTDRKPLSSICSKPVRIVRATDAECERAGMPYGSMLIRSGRRILATVCDNDLFDANGNRFTNDI